MSVPQKLTKKQKKSIAFREHGKTSAHRKQTTTDDEDNAIPIAELQDIDEIRDTALDVVAVERVDRGNKEDGTSGKHEKTLGKGEGKAVEVERKGVKRKRETEDIDEGYEGEVGQKGSGEGYHERKAKGSKEGQSTKGEPKQKKTETKRRKW